MEDIQKLESLIEELVRLGEDPSELAVWKNIFPAMDQLARDEILKNLSEEVESLK